MYRKRFRLLAATAVCVALALLSTERPARAVEPETVSVTFALEVPFDRHFDPTAELSDYVGEDTVVILIGALYESYPLLHFSEGSPPCDGVEVAGTGWLGYAHGTIVNKGGPTYGTVSMKSWPISDPDAPWAPEHSALVAQRITDVHACWLAFGPCGHAIVQDDWNWDTQAVFIIVTGEFHVKG